jgi:hypothetical protein
MRKPLHSHSYTTDQDLKKFAHTQIPDDPKHEPVIPFVEGTISYAGELIVLGHVTLVKSQGMKHAHNL